MVVQHDLWYWPANGWRTLHIHLPDAYNEATARDERYPVMYMFDGHNLFFDEYATYGKSWGLESFLTHWEKPIIIVGMECCHIGHGRLDEYCPYHRTILGHTINPLGEQTFRWLIDDVKPLVDATWRTWPHREATGIGGSSMGGLMSLYGVIRHNDVFSKAACLSTGIRMSEKALLHDFEQSSLCSDTRVYLSCGEHEAGGMRKGGTVQRDSAEAKAMRRMAAHLETRGAKTYQHMEADGKHNESCWERQNGRYLDFLWLDHRW